MCAVSLAPCLPVLLILKFLVLVFGWSVCWACCVDKDKSGNKKAMTLHKKLACVCCKLKLDCTADNIASCMFKPWQCVVQNSNQLRLACSQYSMNVLVNNVICTKHCPVVGNFVPDTTRTALALSNTLQVSPLSCCPRMVKNRSCSGDLMTHHCTRYACTRAVSRSLMQKMQTALKRKS